MLYTGGVWSFITTIGSLLVVISSHTHIQKKRQTDMAAERKRGEGKGERKESAPDIGKIFSAIIDAAVPVDKRSYVSARLGPLMTEGAVPDDAFLADLSAAYAKLRVSMASAVEEAKKADKEKKRQERRKTKERERGAAAAATTAAVPPPLASLASPSTTSPPPPRLPEAVPPPPMAPRAPPTTDAMVAAAASIYPPITEGNGTREFPFKMNQRLQGRLLLEKLGLHVLPSGIIPIPRTKYGGARVEVWVPFATFHVFFQFTELADKLADQGALAMTEAARQNGTDRLPLPPPSQCFGCTAPLKAGAWSTHVTCACGIAMWCTPKCKAERAPVHYMLCPEGKRAADEEAEARLRPPTTIATEEVAPAPLPPSPPLSVPGVSASSLRSLTPSAESGVVLPD